MKTTKDQQTQTYLTETTAYLASSTSEDTSKPSIFNPANLLHKSRLYEWCRVHWPIFCRSLQHQNAVYYHECCNSFSRRHFSKISGHPTLQTSSIATIPSFKEVLSADYFFRWLLKMLTYNTKKGHPCRFPAVNRYHQELDINAAQEDIEDEETTMLKKRVSELNEQLYSVKETSLKTQVDNQRLLECTQMWHQKYQELVESDKVGPEYLTPQKVVRKCSFFEDN